MRSSLIIVILFFVVFSTGCRTIGSRVTRFHSLPSVGAKKTFEIRGSDSGIEFKTYADRVSKHLVAYGWVRNTTGGPSDYVVVLVYDIDGGKTVSGSVPVYGQTGGGTSYTTGSVHTNRGGYANYSGTTYTVPSYGQVGTTSYTETVYNRSLVLHIYDLKESKKNALVTVYEGRVSSSGSSGEISEVLPTMIEALFKSFPGISGKTERLSMRSVRTDTER